MSAPKLRFKEFDGDWVEKNLGDSFNLVSGYAFSSTASVDNGARWLKIADIGIQVMTPNNLSYLPLEFLEKYSQFIVHENDYVIALTRPILNKKLKIARVGKFYDGALLNQRVAKISSEKNNLDYIYYILQKSKIVEELENSIAGTDPPNLSLNSVKEIKLGFPSIQEQTKIASFLSAVDEKISQLTQKYELLGQYKQGMMQMLFSQQIRFNADDGGEFGEWEESSIVKSFKLITDYVASGSFSSLKENVAVSGQGYAHYVRQTDLSSNFQNKDLKFVDEKSYQFLKKSNLFANDILFANIGDLGRVYYMPELDKPATVAPNLIVLRTNSNFSSKFIYYFLCSPLAQCEINKIKGGSGLPKISKTDFKSMNFHFPALNEQTKIANFLSAIDQKIDVVAQQIQHAKLWKKGLLQQMFV